MSEYTYKTRGVCAREIDIKMDGDIVTDVRFIGGCMGNTQGVAALAKGRSAEDLIHTLKGIQCGGKGTSCPDQLATALELVLSNRKD